jgi:hypothetical protein
MDCDGWCWINVIRQLRGVRMKGEGMDGVGKTKGYVNTPLLWYHELQLVLARGGVREEYSQTQCASSG